MNFTWEIYQGQNIDNSSSSIVEWTPIDSSFDHYLFGKFLIRLFIFISFVLQGNNTKNFTAIADLFVENSHISFWRFKLLYSFSTEIISTTLDLQMNDPPKDGHCSIYPSQGTINTLFTIRCSHWIDQDQIKDFFFYGSTDFQFSIEISFLFSGRTSNSSDEIIVAYTNKSTLQIYLPVGDKHTSLFILIVYIRDTFNSFTKYEMKPVIVQPIHKEMNFLIDMLDNPTRDSMMFPLFNLLNSRNPNLVTQTINSLAFQLNQISEQNLEVAISSNNDSHHSSSTLHFFRWTFSFKYFNFIIKI